MISKDEQLLVEAYNQILESMKCNCAYAKKANSPGADSCACSCDCDSCGDCKKNQKLEEAKKAKPDYIDADKDGNKKESLKKSLKDKEGKGNFKNLHKKVMSKTKK